MIQKSLAYVLVIALDPAESGAMAEVITNAEGYGQVELIDVDMIRKEFSQLTREDLLEAARTMLENNKPKKKKATKGSADHGGKAVF